MVPVERQAERLRTPLTQRDRLVLAVLGVVTVLAVAAGSVYAVVHRSSSPPSQGCVVAVEPFSMGGVTVRRCGGAAVSFCRTESPGRAGIANACRRAGFAVPAGA